MYHLQIFLPFSRWPFSFVDSFLHCAKAFWFDVVSFIQFCFSFSCLRIIAKIMLRLISKRVLLMFTSTSLMVSDLKSLIQFEFIFVHGVREQSSQILLHAAVLFSQYHLLQRLSFPHCIILLPSLQINSSHKCGFISGLSILFH